MPLKTIVKKTAKQKIETSFENLAPAAAVSRYLALDEKKKAIEEEMRGIRSYALSKIENGEFVEGDGGHFIMVNAVSLSWTVEKVKALFGSKWSDYVKADDKLVKAKMESLETNGDFKEANQIKKSASAELTVQCRMIKS